MVRFDLGSLLQGQTKITKQNAYNLLIICTTDLGWQMNIWDIMGQESFGVVIFDLGPILQGQTRIMKLKSVYNSLINCPRGLGCETNV